jgi:hypothetical protein
MSSPPPTRPSAGRAPRGRVSRRRYLARRVGALAVVVLLIAGLVRAVGALGGSDDNSVAQASDAPGTTSPGQAADPVDPTATTAPPTSPTSPTTVAEPEHTGPPSSEHPATVMIVGDSDAGTFGPYLEQLLDDTGVVETVLDYKVSSGLARPDFFDWPTEMRTKVPAADPDIVVVTFGGNDAQGLADPSGEFVVGEPRSDSDNAEWRAEYGARVGEVMDFLLEDGRTVIWVGIPNDDNPDVTFRMQVQDETAKAEAAKRPGVVFVDTWARFAGRNGGWAEFVVDPRDGIGKDVRADDGFHLNTTGAEILALEIAQSIRADLAARGAGV